LDRQTSKPSQLSGSASRECFEIILFLFIFVVLVVMVEDAVSPWQYQFRFWYYVAVSFIVTACFVAWRGKSPEIAWAFIAIGWLIALWNLIYLFNDFICSASMGQSSLREQDILYFMMSEYWYIYQSIVVLLLVLTLPAVYLTALACANVTLPRL